ncbi:MFS transporter [Aeromicrobium sp.]|uniref:MFS transporter n=1 Tax=Aeromicrobium sp. TaxID=1871063 RepID=UPI0025C6ECF6|nr:MFS transporter [Aeromicrobium sp.]MCK5890295.1 MFS transporter [Aeromicrobium sp.]
MGLLLDWRFGCIFWGKLLGTVAVFAQSLAAAAVVFQASGSVALVSLVTIAQFAPQLLLGPVAGAWADRGRVVRQLLLGRALCASGATALWLTFVVAEPPDEAVPVIVFVCSLIVGVGFVVGGPAMHIIVPDLVTGEELPRAIALNTLPMTIGRVAGPALGGFSVGVWGPASTFATAAALQLGFLILIVAAQVPTRPPGPSGDRSLRAGVAYVREHPRVLCMLWVTACVGAGAEPTLTLAPALAADLGGQDVLGPLAASFGLGALAAFLVLSAGDRWLSSWWVAWTGLCILVLGNAALARVGDPVVACGAFAIAGAGFAWALTGASIVLQTETDRAYRGRVMAWWSVAFIGSRPMASVTLGVIGDLRGVGTAFAALSAFLLVSLVILALLSWRHARR